MKEYTIPCVWEMTGTLQVKAESWEEAVDIAEGPTCALPAGIDSYYVDASFEVNHDMVEFYKTDEEDYVKELED
jgi:hypothetical protein